MTLEWFRRRLETKDSDSDSRISSQPSGLSFKSDVSKQTIINFCNLIYQSTQNVKKSAEQHETVVIDYLSRKCHHCQVSDASEVFSESDESEDEGIYSRKTRKCPCLNHPLLKSAREAKRSAERHETFVIESLLSKWTSSQWSSDLSSGSEGSLDGTIDSTERAAHLSHKDLPTYHQSMEQMAKWCEELPESGNRSLKPALGRYSFGSYREGSELPKTSPEIKKETHRSGENRSLKPALGRYSFGSYREGSERPKTSPEKKKETHRSGENRSLKPALGRYSFGSYREGSELPKTSPEKKKETHRSGENRSLKPALGRYSFGSYREGSELPKTSPEKKKETHRSGENRSLKPALGRYSFGSYREGSELPKTSPEKKKETHRSGENRSLKPALDPYSFGSYKRRVRTSKNKS
ncbi:uncharacterized protein LOC117806744 isoform X5 [Notolabrus celidotus]|uniref:uncharacterized protein LOC117806744 isoform X5 n=1 Tax=Notolabrus celidotus TaxID=1203425 RepID=UPI0014906927|nr:uncharacterized protein LOC117806744 isoform X5 [Notolabrus celidotus]